jgi:hypothetical protein
MQIEIGYMSQSIAATAMNAGMPKANHSQKFGDIQQAKASLLPLRLKQYPSGAFASRRRWSLGATAPRCPQIAPPAADLLGQVFNPERTRVLDSALP